MAIPFKICGLTREEDVREAKAAGASFLGFIMVPGTPRCISLARAKALFDAAQGAERVLVVGNLPVAEVQQLIDELHPEIVQLHRSEPPEFALALHGARVWRAFALRDAADVQAACSYPAAAIVADTGAGGSGRTGDWSLARRLSAVKSVVIAGGITAENVGAAVRASGAVAADCSSGVEAAPGFKDLARLRAFARACQAIHP